MNAEQLAALIRSRPAAATIQFHGIGLEHMPGGFMHQLYTALTGKPAPEIASRDLWRIFSQALQECAKTNVYQPELFEYQDDERSWLENFSLEKAQDKTGYLGYIWSDNSLHAQDSPTSRTGVRILYDRAELYRIEDFKHGSPSPSQHITIYATRFPELGRTLMDEGYLIQLGETITLRKSKKPLTLSANKLREGGFEVLCCPDCLTPILCCLGQVYQHLKSKHTTPTQAFANQSTQHPHKPLQIKALPQPLQIKALPQPLVIKALPQPLQINLRGIKISI